MNQDQRSWQSCAVERALCGLSFCPPDLRHAERSTPQDSLGLCRLSLSCSRTAQRGLLQSTVILEQKLPLHRRRGQGENSWNILPPFFSTGKCVTTNPHGLERSRYLARRIQTCFVQGLSNTRLKSQELNSTLTLPPPLQPAPVQLNAMIFWGRQRSASAMAACQRELQALPPCWQPGVLQGLPLQAVPQGTGLGPGLAAGWKKHAAHCKLGYRFAAKNPSALLRRNPSKLLG